MGVMSNRVYEEAGLTWAALCVIPVCGAPFAYKYTSMGAWAWVTAVALCVAFGLLTGGVFHVMEMLAYLFPRFPGAIRFLKRIKASKQLSERIEAASFDELVAIDAARKGEGLKAGGLSEPGEVSS